jgi:antitoxin component of MazEF toxin-antitoxin module
MRAEDERTTVRVYDYADTQVPVLRATHTRGLRTYNKSLGFTHQQAPNVVSSQLEDSILGSSASQSNLAFRTSAYILNPMRIVKVRRVGNSNVVSIPREFEASGYAPGSSVLMEELPGGELRIMPTDKLREQIKQLGRRVVAEHPEALKILAEDSSETTTPHR